MPNLNQSDFALILKWFLCFFVNMESTKIDQNFSKIYYKNKNFKKYLTYKYLSLMNFMHLWKAKGVKHVKINKAKQKNVHINGDILVLKPKL